MSTIMLLFYSKVIYWSENIPYLRSCNLPMVFQATDVRQQDHSHTPRNWGNHRNPVYNNYRTFPRSSLDIGTDQYRVDSSHSVNLVCHTCMERILGIHNSQKHTCRIWDQQNLLYNYSDQCHHSWG